MKKIIFISFYFMISQVSSAQNWQWSKKITQPITFYYFGNNKGLLTDKNGIIYSYGSSYSNTATDTIGSFLQSYSASGALLFSKQWKIPFHIQKMDYDGNNYFYFAGKFYGSQTINGISIVSQGKEDGVIGKMDLQGNIIWMKTFGGGGTDAAYGVCFNLIDNSIYISGGIQDTLFFNNSFQSINQQSAIIGNYSVNGTLIRHKLYDFVPERNVGNRNCGVEICHGNTGNIFVLMDRDGKWWSGDSINAAPEGRYIMKLNSNLDTLWSSFIINSGCYYGWTCNSLRVAANGDAYIARDCSEKYGGYCQLLRLNGNTGGLSWNLVNNDGNYPDVFIDSNTVYFIGNEGADGCPCEGNNPGYYVIKKIDENNAVVGETRISGVYLFNITKDILGNIFVAGALGNRIAVLGPDVIIADSVNNGNYYSYNGMFLSKLSDVNCTPPEINLVTHHPFVEIFCPADSVLLDAGTGFLSYLWSNGSSTEKIITNSPGQYRVRVSEASGCIAYSTPITIDTKKNSVAPVICLATYDPASKKNKFIWNLNFDYGTKYYNIYTEASPGNNKLIKTINYTDYNLFEYIDQQSAPDSLSEKYFLTMIDTCGTESPLSEGHRPIFLSRSKNNSSTILSWQPYDGFVYSKYYIYRGTSLSNLSIIDSISSSLTTYTDNNTTQSYYYQVKIKKSHGCYIINSSVYISMSNIIFSDPVTAMSTLKNFPGSIDIYPNPSPGKFTIMLSGVEGPSTEKKYSIGIIDLIGEKVYSCDLLTRQSTIDISDKPKGIYFVEIVSGGKKTVKKIVVE